MKGRYFLNHKGNVPPISPEDEDIVVAILLGFLVFALLAVILLSR
jgi:hypothetical protein